MDIKELDKKQLILLTLLITFVVSIATGIVTVSLMNQMPKSVPQTINNVIQRTIEKVTTVEVPATTTKTNTVTNSTSTESLSLDGGDTLVPIYLKDTVTIVADDSNGTTEVGESSKNPTPLGQGVIISDVGLILVESNILTGEDLYKVILDKTDFNASVLKKFDNGFTILKISQITDTETTKKDISTEVKNQ